MIYIIVPTFARVEDTKKLLSSIQKSIEKEYLVLLIDDHPEKPTSRSIEQNNNVKVFPSNEELWWVGSGGGGPATPLPPLPTLANAPPKRTSP